MDHGRDAGNAGTSEAHTAPRIRFEFPCRSSPARWTTWSPVPAITESSSNRSPSNSRRKQLPESVSAPSSLGSGPRAGRGGRPAVSLSGAETGPGGTIRQMRARASPGTWLRSDRLGEPVDRQDDPGEGNRSGQAPSTGTDRGNEAPGAPWRVKSRPRNRNWGGRFSLCRGDRPVFL